MTEAESQLLFAKAAALDAADELAGFRERFVLSDPDEVYLDGNSLGRLPTAARDLAAELVADGWGRQLISGWNAGWWEAPTRIGDQIGRLIGADPSEVVVADSTSVNLFRLLTAVLQAAGGGSIVVEDSNFPSDAHVVHAVVRLRGPPSCIVSVDAEGCEEIDGVPAALSVALDDRPAAAVLSHVSYRSGYRFDMAAVERAAAARGVRVVWDLSHSVGAVPIDVNRDGVRFAVGCTYKYLNGGPGAPAFLYVAREHQRELGNPIGGWVGQRDPFAMSHAPDPADGVRRFLSRTPSILSLYPIGVGVEITLEAGMDKLWSKARRQLDWFDSQVEAALGRCGLVRATPCTRHGSHVSYAHPEARRIVQALVAAKVTPDFRPPNLVRFGIAPLYTRYVDLANAVVRLEEVMEKESWRGYSERAEGVVT